jgi:hypothetical protein
VRQWVLERLPFSLQMEITMNPVSKLVGDRDEILPPVIAYCPRTTVFFACQLWHCLSVFTLSSPDHRV